MGTIPASENEFPSLLFAEGAAPSTPGTGLVKAYAKSDGLLYWKDDAGTEYAVGQGDVTAHTGDTADAHDASAISVLDTATNFTGTDVEAVLAELQDNIDGVAAGGAANPSVGSPQALHSLGTSIASALAADRVYFTKFIPTADVTVDTAAWNCGTSAGNLDLGIYDAALTTKLGSTGAFSSPGTGNRTQALTGSVALTAGTVYYLAFWSSNASLRVPTYVFPAAAGFGTWNLVGIQSSVSTNLPSSITATWDPGAIGVPIFWFLV